jgi:hypothetical protein
LELVWEKPVIIFYKERLEEPERKAFTVVKGRRLLVSQTEDGKFRGNITDFFPLMGDLDYILTNEGKVDRYVLCWLDDKEDDFSKAWRRLNGVFFPNGVSLIVDEKEKKTYNSNFVAKHGKLD